MSDVFIEYYGDMVADEPACMGPEGCQDLADHAGKPWLSAGQCMQLGARCLEHSERKGTASACVIADSIIVIDPWLDEYERGDLSNA